MSRPHRPSASQRQPITLLPKVPLLTLEDLARRIRQRGVTADTVAYSIVLHVKDHVPADGVAFGTDYHVWGAGGVILAALRNGDFNPTSPIRILDERATMILLKEAAGLTSARRMAARDRTETNRETEKAFLRMTCCQDSLQGDHADQAARTLDLLEAVNLATGELLLETPYDALYQQAFGCSLFEYLSIVIGLYAAAIAGRGLVVDISTFFCKTDHPGHMTEVARRLLDRLECSVAEAPVVLREQFGQYEGEGLAQAFFTKRPFLT